MPVYPQSGKAEVYTWQLRALVGDVRSQAHEARGFADPLDDALLDRPRPRRPHDARTRDIHRPESMADDARGRAAG